MRFHQQGPTGTQVPGQQQPQVRVRRMGLREWFRGLKSWQQVAIVGTLVVAFAPVLSVGLLALVTGFGFFLPILLGGIVFLCFIIGGLAPWAFLVYILVKVAKGAPQT